MPPITKPKVKCIKFGEILIDENKKVALLCVNCYEDFNFLTDFCKHLKDCKSAKRVFQSSKPGSKLLCDTGNLLTKVNQKSRELRIYGLNENSATNSICDIEAEILNPRWYTDAAASSPIRTLNKNRDTYNNLIAEVTPFVQFKENVKTLSTPIREPAPKLLKIPKTTDKVDALPNKKPPQPNIVTTTKPITTATNATHTQNLPKRSIPMQAKPASAKNLPSISPPSTASRNEKRTYSTLLTSQPSSTANVEFAAPTASKRARNSAATALAIRPNAAPKDKLPYVSQTITGVKNQQQTLKIHPQITINTHRTSVPQKPSINVIQTTPEASIKSQTVCQTLPKPSTVRTTTAATQATAPTPPFTNNKSTVDILNKLQTLGLKVQRTNPAPKPASISSGKDAVAMEIIKKLQSKGMEIKRVSKTSQ